jgi:hypothetical protein
MLLTPETIPDVSVAKVLFSAGLDGAILLDGSVVCPSGSSSVVGFGGSVENDS